LIIYFPNIYGDNLAVSHEKPVPLITHKSAKVFKMVTRHQKVKRTRNPQRTNWIKAPGSGETSRVL